MGYRNKFSSDLYRVSSLLSQKVSKKDPFFQKIALMGIEERIKYATLFVILEKDLLNKDLDTLTDKELLEDVIMPIIQRIGQAKFRADPLTHLGMKIGETSTRANWDDDSEE